MGRSLPSSASLLVLGLAACGGDDGGTGPTPTGPLCSTPLALTLEVGQYQIIDAARTTNCVSLPGGLGPREYVVMAYSGAGTETSSGVSAPYLLQGRSAAEDAALEAEAGMPLLADLPGADAFSTVTPEQFHRRLRLAEHRLALSPAALFRSPPPAAPIPVLGTIDSFSVCNSLTCGSFRKIGATVRYVGRAGVIYTDNGNSTAGEQLNDGDITQLGQLFDDYLHPIDTTAFGGVSDINADQRIAILVTGAVNALTDDCRNGRVVGYFYGGDLLLFQPGSNRREVFYAFAPKEATPTCSAVTRARALSQLPATLIHELQHMISFNQRVLVRGGGDEDLWLNEGLSHFAEELGYRVLPDAKCPNSSSCFSEFMSGNLSNAYSYLNNPEATHVVTPGDNSGPLAYRGAGWLFVRWLADHFAADTLLGPQVTRALINSTARGGENAALVGGAPFATLLGEWHLANYLENLQGVSQTGRLRYRTWDLRDVYGRNSPAVFPKPYPLTPEVTAGSYGRNGVLRGGSGRHLRFQLGAGSPGQVVRLASGSSGAAIATSIEPRFAVVRIQ